MLRSFDYIKPADVTEVVSLLQQEGAYILSGGTDLILKMREAKIRPKIVVDIKELPDFKGIKRLNDGSVWVGSLTTMKELANNPLIINHYSALSEAASVMGCYEIRVRATLGGNICNGSPGAETGSVLAIFNASVEVIGKNGLRVLPIEEFMLGPGRVALESGELVKGFILPSLLPGTKSTYLRRGRIKGMDLAAIGVSVLAGTKFSDGTREIRVAAGAVSPTPVRVKPVEDILKQGPLVRSRVKEGKKVFAQVISPRATSIRATPEYKREMAGILMELALDKLSVLEYRLEEESLDEA
ncbi:MAG: FAD binding domain-containing protein [Bacillota bacterium]|jgi:CO/xanthine dehydrogenase FAD-binding subunit